MTAVGFIDTTIRDGHLSLWASNMTTGMMLPVAKRLDGAGFEAIELICGSDFLKCVRELREDPFERIRLVAERITETPLRLIAGGINPFRYDPHSMYRLFLELVVTNGIGEVRISDPWNELDGWRYRVKEVRDVGLVPIINMIYSISPRHTDEYFAERTRQAVTLPIDRLCLKDPGGLLTPERMQTLVPVVLENAGAIAVEFHTHCTTGLGPLSTLEAIKLGIPTVNTAIPPLANGASNPSLFNVAANARALGYQPNIDEDALRPVSDHFMAVAKREGFPLGAPVEYDYAQYLHQVPGGMLSNLRHQLGLVGLAHKYDQALEETARVRAELGYPIMVTPLSQFVGSQAVVNIIVGERYREITDQVINYALGRYGAEAVTAMDGDIRDRILDTPRARELARDELPEPSLDEMKRKYGGPGISDVELMLRWLTSKDDVDAVRAAGTPSEYDGARAPVVGLIEDLAGRSGCNRIRLRRPGLSLTMEKRGAAP